MWWAISGCVGGNRRVFGGQYLGVCYVIFLFVVGNIWVCGGQLFGVLVAISGSVVAISGCVVCKIWVCWWQYMVELGNICVCWWQCLGLW